MAEATHIRACSLRSYGRSTAEEHFLCAKTRVVGSRPAKGARATRVKSLSIPASRTSLRVRPRLAREQSKLVSLPRPGTSRRLNIFSAEASASASDEVMAKTSYVETLDIVEGTKAIRCVEDTFNKFEKEFSRNRGSSQNSYVIQGDTIALIDLPDSSWSSKFVDALKEATEGKELNTIVLNNFGPKQAGTLAAVLEAQGPDAPTIEVYCSNPTRQLLTAMLKRGSPQAFKPLQAVWKLGVVRGGRGGGLRARLVRVRNGDRLNLGQDHFLSFITAPTPRWPEGMWTYDPVSQQVYSGKVFSAHTDAQMVEAAADAEGHLPEMEHFFDCLLRPVARQLKAAMQRFDPQPPSKKKKKRSNPSALAVFTRKFFTGKWSGDGQEDATADVVCELKGICPMHGPVIEQDALELVQAYNRWIDEELSKADSTSVAVIYCSAYGNTGAMAQAVCEGLAAQGVAVESLNCEFATAKEVAALITRSQGFALGSPTLGGHVPSPMSEALGAILKEPAASVLPYGVFGSYGWSGEAVDIMQRRLEDGGFSNVFDPISVKFVPTEEMLGQCRDAGGQLAEAVMLGAAKQKIQKRKMMSKTAGDAGTTDGRMAAVGRIVSSCCALTTKSPSTGTESIMLASWVTQASFAPPGISVALSKENSPDGLLLLNSKFVLNVISNKNERALLKKLLNQGFKTGEAAFTGLEVRPSELHQCAIIEDSQSYLECTIKDRMDTGDHWVLYAEVDGGEVLENDSGAFFRHRTTGMTY